MGRALILAAVAALPAYWEPIESLTAAGAEAVAADDGFEGTTEAWGDPATGTYGVVQTVRSKAPVRGAAHAIEQVHAGARDELARQGAELESFDVAPRGAVSESIARYRAAGMTGQTRTQVVIEADGRLRVTSATCLFTERDPERSSRQCERFLQQWSQGS